MRGPRIHTAELIGRASRDKPHCRRRRQQSRHACINLARRGCWWMTCVPSADGRKARVIWGAGCSGRGELSRRATRHQLRQRRPAAPQALQFPSRALHILRELRATRTDVRLPGRRRSGALRVRGGSIERPSPWCALAAGRCPRRGRHSFNDHHQLAGEAGLCSHLHQSGWNWADFPSQFLWSLPADACTVRSSARAQMGRVDAQEDRGTSRKRAASVLISRPHGAPPRKRVRGRQRLLEPIGAVLASPVPLRDRLDALVECGGTLAVNAHRACSSPPIGVGAAGAALSLGTRTELFVLHTKMLHCRKNGQRSAAGVFAWQR